MKVADARPQPSHPAPASASASAPASASVPYTCLLNPVPSCVHRIIHRRTPDRFAHLISDVFQLPGGHPAVNTSGFHLRACEDDRSGGDNRMVANLRVIHNNGSHAHKHVIAQRTTVDDGAMGDRDVIADDDPGPLGGAVDNRTILDVRIVANRNGMQIAPNRGAVPYRTVVAHHHFANHHGGLSQKAVFSKFGCKPPDGTDQCHSVLFFCQSSTSQNFPSENDANLPDKMSRQKMKSLYFCVLEVCSYGGIAGRYWII